MNFTIDRSSILDHSRCQWINDLVPIDTHISNIEKFINECYDSNYVVQNGRVIALRATDANRLSSAFKAGIYLGKYNDMANEDRFLKNMVSAHHSYEPIRGESYLFLFIGVGKPVYDHLITYNTGRTSRIAGGQRANVPWGFELPVEAKNAEEYEEELNRIRNVVRLAKQEKSEQMQSARSKLPVGYIMPPFILEFSEEALIKHVFKQRLFENGAQGATVEIVNDMWQCCMKVDKEKWTILEDYHGSHVQQWEKVMRTLHKERPTIEDLFDKIDPEIELGNDAIMNLDLYESLIGHYGKMPVSMWDKQK